MKLIDKLILPVALALIVSVAGIVARVAVATNASAQPEGIELPIVMYHHILKDQSRLNKYTMNSGATCSTFRTMAIPRY